MRNLYLCAALAIAACGGKKDEPKPEAKPAPKAETKPAAKPDPVPAKPMTPPDAAPDPDALVEHDLSSLGPMWKGWKVDAPDPQATLEKYDEPYKGGVAIRWGNGAGAMGFYQGKLDFKLPKADWKTTGDTTVDSETATELDATMDMMGTKLKCFHLNLTMGGNPVGCWTVSCVMTDDELARAKKICASLRKS
jgi:hypothetical protein